MEKGYKGNSRNHFWVVNCTWGGKMAEKKADRKYPCKVVVFKNKVKCLPTVTGLLLTTISPPEQAKNKMMKEYNIIWGKWQALKMGSSSLTLCPALKKTCAPGYNRFLLSLQMIFFEEQIIMEYHYHGRINVIDVTKLFYNTKVTCTTHERRKKKINSEFGRVRHIPFDVAILLW